VIQGEASDARNCTMLAMSSGAAGAADDVLLERALQAFRVAVEGALDRPGWR
jgi:hypothetical protein